MFTRQTSGFNANDPCIAIADAELQTKPHNHNIGRDTIFICYQERRAREVLTTLIQKYLVVSTGLRKPVRLNFPSEVADRWFQKLYTSE